MNQEQQFALETVKKNHSILLSGAAGTGKSYTLSEIIKWAHASNKKIGVTATTGSAALLIGGRTIHSFLGIGLGSKSAKDWANMVFLKNKKVLAHLKNLDILIIDEISMLDDELFGKISEFMGILRMNPELPFGGLQLVLCGDFSQNCPVNGQYCFLSKGWEKLDIKKIFLKKLMRHKDDEEFQEILESLRFGKVTKSIMDRLELLKKTEFPEGVEPTILYGKNVDVDVINNKNFKKLVEKGAKMMSYEASYCGPMAKAWAQSCKVPEKLNLCIGSQVVLTWNVSVDTGLVNGSRGVIAGFSKISDNPIIKFYGIDEDMTMDQITIKNEDEPKNTITFMPIKLAWAMTISKSQGCTLDYCIMDLASWACGQSYTALSRVRSLKNVKLIRDIKESYFKASPAVIKFYSEA